MPIDTYSVVIFTGQPKPEPVKAVGPFPSHDDAEAWIQAEGYDAQARKREWAVVLPAEAP